jgi:hypothetical protein
LFGLFNPLSFELERERYHQLLREAELWRRHNYARRPSAGPTFSLGRLLVRTGYLLVRVGCRLQGRRLPAGAVWVLPTGPWVLGRPAAGRTVGRAPGTA